MGGGVINDMGPYMIDVCTRFSKRCLVNSNIRNGINHLDPIFISAQFGQNIFLTYFGLIYLTKTRLNFSDNLVVSLERVFSPPSDYEAVILKQSDGRSTELQSVQRMYLNFIFNVFLSFTQRKISLPFFQSLKCNVIDF